MRSAQTLKLLLTGVRVMPIPDSVNVANFRQFIDEDGTFKPNDLLAGAAKTMLDELLRWTRALQPCAQIAGARVGRAVRIGAAWCRR